jgi:hypothetical protein
MFAWWPEDREYTYATTNLEVARAFAVYAFGVPRDHERSVYRVDLDDPIVGDPEFWCDQNASFVMSHWGTVLEVVEENVTMTVDEAREVFSRYARWVDKSPVYDNDGYATVPPIWRNDKRAFQTIVFRTDLITDPEVLAAVDATVAAQVAYWPSLTQGRLSGQVDKIVARADADAVRRRQQRHTDREIWIGEVFDGLAEIGGSLLGPDAHALEKRLEAARAAVRSAAPMPWARWPPRPTGWGVAAGAPSARPANAPPRVRWSFM